MSRALLLAMLASAALAPGQCDATPDLPTDSRPRGPGSSFIWRYTEHRPLPKRASQAKRRRLARRAPGRK